MPCLPLAGQLLKPTVKVEVHELPGSVTVDFLSVAFLSFALTIFVLSFLASLVSNHRLRKRIVDLTSSDEKHRWQNGTTSEEDQDCTNGIHDNYYSGSTMEEDLLAPLTTKPDSQN